MKAIVVGCGRVGSKVAKKLAKVGLGRDRDRRGRRGAGSTRRGLAGRIHRRPRHGRRRCCARPASRTRTPSSWRRTATTRTSSSARSRRSASASSARVVRILDPARAELYATLGLRVVCPTSSAIDVLTEAVKSCCRPARAATACRGSLMFVLVAGGGKVGSNLARTLLRRRPRGGDRRAATRSLGSARGGVRAPRDPRGRDGDLRARAAPASRVRRISSSRSRATTRTTWSSARWPASTTARRR